MHFPGGASGKEPAFQCRRCKRCSFNLWVRKIPWKRVWLPTPVFLPRKSHGQRNLEGYSAWGCKESDMTERLSTHTFMWEEKGFFQLKKTHNGCHPSTFLSKLLEGVL